MLKPVTRVWVVGVCCLLATGLGNELLATDLNGQVLAIHPYASKPFPDERATIVLTGEAGQYEAQTGNGGYFYLYDVRPGRYELAIKSPYGESSRAITVSDHRAQRIDPVTLSR
jgi:hypothetical protein